MSRPFYLTVDSASPNWSPARARSEALTRRWLAFDALAPQWRPFAWITEEDA